MDGGFCRYKNKGRCAGNSSAKFQLVAYNNRWRGRAQTIWKAHQEAANDLGDTTVTKENVRQVWAKLIPGITDEFDCPLEGAQVAFEEARNATG